MPQSADDSVGRCAAETEVIAQREAAEDIDVNRQKWPAKRKPCDLINEKEIERRVVGLDPLKNPRHFGAGFDDPEPPVCCSFAIPENSQVVGFHASHQAVHGAQRRRGNLIGW